MTCSTPRSSWCWIGCQCSRAAGPCRPPKRSPRETARKTGRCWTIWLPWSARAWSTPTRTKVRPVTGCWKRSGTTPPNTSPSGPVPSWTTPAPPTATTTWTWSRPPPCACAARTRLSGWTGWKPSSTTSCQLRDRFDNDDSPVPSMAGEALRIARGLADHAIAADALSQLCWFRFERGDLPAALADIGEAVGLARATGDPRLIAHILGYRAVFEGEAGDLDGALADHQEVLTLSRTTGDSYRLAITLANLGVYELAAWELGAARTHFQEASTLA